MDYSNVTHYTTQDDVNNDHGHIESRKCIVLPLMYFMLMKKDGKV